MQYVNSELATKANDSDVVHLSGLETISGTKTFANAPTVPAPMGTGQVANKAYVDQAVSNVGAGNYLSTAGGTMTGPILLPGNPVAAMQATTKQYVDMGFATKADLVSGFIPANELGSGSATAGTCLLGNGTWGACGSGGGTGNVSTTPADNQNVAQPAGTQFGVNSLDNIHYADLYNWTQSPSGSLTGGTLATVILTPGPRGMDTSNNVYFPFYVYIAGMGTPEAVQVTGGTCTAGGATSCTIQFTPTNSHGAGFTVQSATSGAAEAGYDANQNGPGSNVAIVLQPASSGTNNNTRPFIFYAPWFPRFSNGVIDGAGAVIAVNNKRAGIVFNNSNNASNTVRHIRFMSMQTLTGAAISNTACSGTTATITTTLNPAMGDVVDVMLTPDQFFWGPHTVTASSSTQYSYTVGSCGTSHPSTASAGYANWQQAAIEDNGFGNHFRDIAINNGGAPYNGLWNNGIVVLGNEQDAFIDGLEAIAGNCSTAKNWCASAVYAPFYPAIVKVANSDLSLNCSANGITYYGGNGLAVDHTVVQGYMMWGIRGGTLRGGFQGTTLNNDYEEIGGCTNPFYTPNQFTGVEQYGSPVIVSGGVLGTGLVPTFATGGSTTYRYYLVTHTTGGSSGTNQSGPIAIGLATPSGNAVTVSWPRAFNDVGGTTTYDIIRATDALNAPTTAACTGGSASSCGSVVTGLAQCSSANLQCTFADNVSVNTTSYTVLTPSFGGSGIGGASYVPTFAFFPGNFTLQGGAWLNYQGGNINSGALTGFGAVSAMNSLGPVYTDAIPGKTNSYLRIDGRFSGSAGGAASNVGGTIPLVFYKQSNGQSNNAMGSIIMANPLSGVAGGSYTQGEYAITTATPNSQQVLAANGYRFTASANDSGIGFDSSATTNPASISSAYASPTGHSFYVGSLLDGTSWLERLTSAAKTFKVPVTVNGNLTVAGGNVTLPITRSGSQCLHVSSTGVLSGTGSDCGSGGGGSGTVNSGATAQLAMYSGNGTAVSGDSQLTDSGTVLSYAGSGGISAATGTFSGNLTVNGQLQVAGPWLVSSPIPGTAMAAAGTATSALGVSNDGNFYISVNGGSPQKVATSGTSSYFPNLWQEDANTLGAYNGTNAQGLHIYGTYTNASNYERTGLGWDAADNYFVLRNENAGTGGQHGIGFWIGSGIRWAIDAASVFKPFSNNSFDIGAVTPSQLVPRTVYAGTSFDTLTQGRLNFELCNDTVTGTALNFLAEYNSTNPACAVKAGTSDTDGLIGIVSNGSGTSGNAVIAYRGYVPCSFDGSTVAGDFVVGSTTNAGDCHDAGATRPTGLQVVGRVESTNTGAGTYGIRASLDSPEGGGLPDPGANGIVIRNGANSTLVRNLVAGSANVSISNPGGIGGNPTIDVRRIESVCFARVDGRAGCSHGCGKHKYDTDCDDSFCGGTDGAEFHLCALDADTALQHGHQLLNGVEQGDFSREWF